MDVFDYLNQYKDIPFKEKRFNEVDALIISMLSYVPFDDLKLGKNKTRASDVYKLADLYVPPFNCGERKLKYLKVLKEICVSKRYGKAIFAYFRKERDPLNDIVLLICLAGIEEGRYQWRVGFIVLQHGIGIEEGL